MALIRWKWNAIVQTMISGWIEWKDTSAYSFVLEKRWDRIGLRADLRVIYGFSYTLAFVFVRSLPYCNDRIEEYG